MTKASVLIMAVLAFTASGAGQTSQANPIRKVLKMLTNLQQTIITEGKDAQVAYEKYVGYCQRRSQDLAFSIKDGKAQHDKLTATIAKETANVDTLSAKMEDLSGDISANENELKSAAALRKKEAADFSVEEKDLSEIIDSLERAISVFSKKANAAALLQTKETDGITEALQAMVDSTAMSSEDASRLTALVQEHSLQSSADSDADSDSDEDMGAPAAAAHTKSSGGIVETLEGLSEKADAKLSKIRKAEAVALQNYEMLHQSLTDEIKFAKDDMNKAKVDLAESKETKSVAAGDLDLTTKDLQRDVTAKELLHHECMTEAQNFEAGVKSRQQTLNTLASAKKAIDEIGAANVAKVSFVQVTSKTKSRTVLASVKLQVVRLVRKLASKTKSMAMAQLASRMSAAMKLDADGGDPFGKVKSMIRSMVSQLEAEAEQEATHKAYCDKEMKATTAHKEDATTEMSSLTSKKNQKDARAVELREQISVVQKELAEVMKVKGEITELRREEEDIFKKEKTEMDQALRGIRLALKILKEHYGQSTGAESGIINLLEVIESDFSKTLAGLTVDEETAANYFKSETIPNIELEQAAKEADVKYKTKEYMGLNKVTAELSSDISGVQTRLDSILQYDATIKKTCTSEPTTYDESKSRRDEEIAGLKEALESLDGAALLQIGSVHKLRGAQRHN